MTPPAAGFVIPADLQRVSSPAGAGCLFELFHERTSFLGQLAVDLLFILGEIIEVKGAFSHLTELHELEVQFSDFSDAFLVIVDCPDKVPEVDNIVTELKLWRKTPGIFQEPVGHPEVLGHPGVVVKAQRFPGIFEVVELTVRDRFPDPLLCYL